MFSEVAIQHHPIPSNPESAPKALQNAAAPTRTIGRPQQIMWNGSINFRATRGLKGESMNVFTFDTIDQTIEDIESNNDSPTE